MENKIYLRFMGGLGNQMFQYAFMRSLIAHGQDAYPNMEWFQQNQNSSLNFVLPEVFPKVIIPMANDNDCKNIECNIYGKTDYNTFWHFHFI